MKTRMMVVILVAAASMASAQTHPVKDLAAYFAIDRGPNAVPMDKVVKNLQWCLQHECTGVVSSAMSHLVRLRVAHPEMTLRGAESAINKLVFDGETPLIRYEAYLASAAFENPAIIQLSDCDPDWAPERLFATIAINMQATNFGTVPPTLSAFTR
jgi:hypothetical protein